MSSAYRFLSLAFVSLAVACGGASDGSMDEDLGSSAAASTTYSYLIGSGTMDAEYARGTAYSTSQTDAELRCPLRMHVDTIEVSYGGWGTAPSINGLIVTCVDPNSGATSVVQKKHAAPGILEPFAPSPRVLSCVGSSDWPVGFETITGDYIKDTTFMCARVSSGSTFSTISLGSRGGFTRTFESGSNDQDEDSCNGSRVLTGVAISYVEDADELALTNVRLLCSAVTMH